METNFRLMIFKKPGLMAKSAVKTACRHYGRRFCCGRHFDAVLVSMLTTSTRRLIGSIGAFGSFGLLLP